ncbi:glycosyltransferase involved in cell wall biosynthesis [Deinobacterium chartae]|uniref:Glycosyltransferase involved in cell wall biosynthesis n=1 Tax=Deinobacterium chartae TaxID=521158 RepID=A0A841I275_9DEIO|nr:glycosyltransferase family 4 protein [Deinobacterium chartae]MBB6099787.1 glycosyltransferase involved in cell wall biosynthesis [Deinobacterium chartae]
MTSLRIGLFTDVYLPNPNGVSTSVYLLHRELRRQGHDAWVMTPWMPDAPQTSDSGVVRIRSLSYPFFEGQRLALPRSKRLPSTFDLIHTHTPLVLGMWGLQLARRQDLPHVSTFHTHYEKYAHYVPGLERIDRSTHLIPRVARAFYQRADVVIAPTDPIRDLVRSYRITRPIEVIPTGIDTPLLEASPEVPSPWPQGTRRLLTVSRLGPEKNLERVIEALAELRREHPAHLVIVGEGPQKADLEAYARRLGVGEHLTLLGAVPYREVGGYYRHAEAFLFASETETQGLVLWEAQAMGVPAVAVGAEGTLEGVLEGVSGYLVAPGDSAALAERTRRLLADPKLHDQLSRGAREFAEQRSAERIAERVLEAYERASSERRVRRSFSQVIRRVGRSSLASSRRGF